MQDSTVWSALWSKLMRLSNYFVPDCICYFCALIYAKPAPPWKMPRPFLHHRCGSNCGTELATTQLRFLSLLGRALTSTPTRRNRIGKKASWIHSVHNELTSRDI